MLKSRLVWVAAAVLVIYYVVITGFIAGGSMNSARNTDKQTNIYLAQFDEMDKDVLIETLQNKALELTEFVFAPENADRIHTEKGRYGETLMEDFVITVNAAETVQYLLRDYPEKMTETVNRSREAISRLSDDKYAVKEQQKIISQYNRVRHFELRSGKAAATWLSMQNNYDYFGILLILAVLVLSAECFTCEHLLGMSGMVFAAPNGRLKLFLVKLSAMMIVAAAAVFLYAAADLFTSIYYMEAKTLGEPLQAVSEFLSCPFSITIFGYIAAKHILLFFLLFTVIGMSASVCSFIKNGFAAAAVSVLPYMAGIFMWRYLIMHTDDVFVSERLSQLRLWLPVCFIDISYYFKKFDCVEFCGIPAERLTICIAVSVLIFTLTTILAASRYGKPGRLKG